MKTHIEEIEVQTGGKSLHEVTRQIRRVVGRSGLSQGNCTVFIQHTSASLVIQENADPSARRDLESWVDRLVDEDDPHFTHTAEGPDDMPSHIKAALTATSLVVPFRKGSLLLGTWQGIYLWEHRARGHCRSIAVSLIGEE